MSLKQEDYYVLTVTLAESRSGYGVAAWRSVDRVPVHSPAQLCEILDLGILVVSGPNEKSINEKSPSSDFSSVLVR